MSYRYAKQIRQVLISTLAMIVACDECTLVTGLCVLSKIVMIMVMLISGDERETLQKSKVLMISH